MPGARNILGVSAFYHDSAAALVCDGRIVAAAQEERFSRHKNDEQFPVRAIEYCLREAALAPGELSAVVFYDKPITKFTRLLETYLAVAPAGWRTFPRVLPGWLSQKLDVRGTIRREIPGLTRDCAILFTAHHQAHAASAFHPSPFTDAAILTVDGVGEWATTVISRGTTNTIETLLELRFPHSLGLLYSAFTAYCGFRINSGEYKLMGLAPYGEPRFANRIRDELLDLKEDGSFRLNLAYFDFLRGVTMTNDRFHRLFEGRPRRADEPLISRHCDVARSVQLVTEEVMLRLARHAREITGATNLCLAGGVALNCVANGRILREGIFERLWIQPAAGDSGGALGAALAAWHTHFRAQHVAQHTAEPRPAPVVQTASPLRANAPSSPRHDPLSLPADAMQGALLGPAYTTAEARDAFVRLGAHFVEHSWPELFDQVASLLAQEKVVAWFQGRMEFGPRALGNRSILGDPRSPRMQSVMNLKVKFRESFRPFAPAVLADRAAEYFELEHASPYMLLVASVRPHLRTPPPAGLQGVEKLQHPHSTLPAVTHVDYAARVQTVTRETNPRFHALLSRFAEKTGCPVLINTSFNVRGEPIVCSPEDAYRCFMHSEIDVLVVENLLLERAAQPAGAAPRRPELQSD